VRALTGERGRLYEIPLLFAFSVVLAALAAPYLEPRRGVAPLVVLGALLLLGLGASALLGAAVSPRVRLLGLPAAVVVFVALSLVTHRSCGGSALAPLLLPAQIYVAYRVELLLAGAKARREREGGSG
jgi:hypothetical protein